LAVFNLYKVTEQEYLKGLKETTEYTGINPKKFILFLGMASMTMYFAALTSALIIKKGDFKSWENFKLPIEFMYSTVAIVAVSVLMHMALLSYKKLQFATFRKLLTAGFISAIVFLGFQYFAWQKLTNMGMPLSGNIAGQFIYLISYAHAFHILIGLLVSAIFLFFAFKARKDEKFELSNVANPDRLLHMELLVYFWHFIDVVWIYLYFFFYFNYQ